MTKTQLAIFNALQKLEAYNETRNHPVLNKAIAALRTPAEARTLMWDDGKAYDHAMYLINQDSDKFEQDEKAWLRANNFLPKLWRA